MQTEQSKQDAITKSNGILASGTGNAPLMNTEDTIKLSVAEQFKKAWGVSTEEAYVDIQDIFNVLDQTSFELNSGISGMIENILCSSTTVFLLSEIDINEDSKGINAISKLIRLAFFNNYSWNKRSWPDEIEGMKTGTPEYYIDRVLRAIVNHTNEERWMHNVALILINHIHPEGCKPLSRSEVGELLFMGRYISELFRDLEINALPGIKHYLKSRGE